MLGYRSISIPFFAFAAFVFAPFSIAQDDVAASTDAINIEAQPLADALKEFSDQTGLQLAYIATLADNKSSNGVKNAASPNDALAAILDDTGLEYQFVNDDTIAIGVPTESEVNSDPGNARPALVLMAQNQGRTVSRSGELQSASDEGARRSLPLEEIVVTGTAIRGRQNRTVPVVEISREDIIGSGVGTLVEFSRLIPQNFSSQYFGLGNSTSANEFAPRSSDTRGTTIDLRGLGPQATLTVLNGRRVNQTSLLDGFDVSILPISVIERIDVLTDGASAVYGADAVAGVVNFITRRDFEGMELSARTGQVTNGDKRDFSLSGVAGMRWGEGGAFIGGDLQDLDPLLDIDRDFISIPGGEEFPDSQLIPAIEQQSFFGSLDQSIGDRSTVFADVFRTRRDVNTRQLSRFGRGSFDVREQSIESTIILSRLSYRIADGLYADLFLDYSESVEEQSSSFRNGVELPTSRKFEADNTTIEARLSGRLLKFPAGDVEFALGGQLREEETSTFDVFGSSLSQGASRDIVATYAEFVVPVIGEDQGIPLVQELEVSVAGRYDDYSDVGGELSPKIGVFWEIGTGLSFRGSYSESFRPAGVFGNSQGSRAFVFGVPDPLLDPANQSPLVGDGQAVSVILGNSGNEGLVPETSDSWTAAILYQPESVPGLVFDLTLWSISYEDAIVSVNPFLILGQPGFEEALAIRNPSIEFLQGIIDRAIVTDPDDGFPPLPPPGVLTFTDLVGLNDLSEVQVYLEYLNQNLAVFDVNGADFRMSYTTSTGFGDISASINASYINEYKQAVEGGLPAPDTSDLIFRPADLKLRGTLGWNTGGFGVLAALNYVDGYKDDILSGTPQNPASINSYTTIDLSISYSTEPTSEGGVFDDMDFTLAVQNIADEEPPFIDEPNGVNFDSANADPLGRFISLQVSKRWN